MRPADAIPSSLSQPKPADAISLRGRNVLQPKPADAICKLKHETKKGLTFEEKIELLERFVLEEGRVQVDDDVFENFRIGTFYKSLIRSKDKYDDLVDKFKSASPTGSDPEDAPVGTDGSYDDDGRRRPVRRGHVKKTKNAQHGLSRDSAKDD